MLLRRALFIAIIASTGCGSPKEPTAARAAGGEAGSSQEEAGAGSGPSPSGGAGGDTSSCAVVDSSCTACGQGCNSEGCSDGKCVLEPLYEPPMKDNVVDMALGPQALFFTNAAAEVLRRALTGGEPSLVFDGAGDRILGMSADSEHVHWVGRMTGKVYVADAQGEQVDVLATLAGQPFDLAVADKATLYVSLQDSGQIWSVARNNGDIAKVATTTAGPSYVAADADYVVWSNVLAGDVGYLVRATGDTKTLATGQMQPSNITLRNGVAYWVNATSSDMSVVSKTLPNGELVTLASMMSSESLALSGDYFYFAAGPAAYRARLDGSAPPQAIVTGYQRLGTLVTDDTWLYFSDYYLGSIGRVAK